MTKKSPPQPAARPTGPPCKPDVPLPSPQQLREYADRLPAVYADILTAFQRADPDRYEGDGLLVGTLKARLATDTDYNPGVIGVALGRLAEGGFFHYEDYPGVYRPSRLGEELLAAVTGHRAKPFSVPDLPKPNW